MADLESALYEPDQPDESGDLPEVSDRGHADKILRRVDRLRREALEVIEFARSEVTRIEAWRDERLATIALAEEREVERLRSYHQMERAQKPGLLTIKLPNGSLVARAQQPEWIFDEQRFVDWALENLPDALNPPGPPTVNKAAAKKLLTQERELEDGHGKVEVEQVFGVTAAMEVPAGLHVERRPRKYDVSVDTKRPSELDRAAAAIAAMRQEEF